MQGEGEIQLADDGDKDGFESTCREGKTEEGERDCLVCNIVSALHSSAALDQMRLILLQL